MSDEFSNKASNDTFLLLLDLRFNGYCINVKNNHKSTQRKYN